MNKAPDMIVGIQKHPQIEPIIYLLSGPENC